MKKQQKKEQKSTAPKGFQPGQDFIIFEDSTVAVMEKQPGTIHGAVGGFHTLCADVGQIPGHPLSGFRAGDILPMSLWNTYHRPACPDPRRFVYDPGSDIWVRIYLEQDKENLLSLSFNDYVTYGKDRGWCLPAHEEFSSAAEGSNEMTNIRGSRRPSQSGGHVDTRGRRMISNIGCEDCCGVLFQWLSSTDPDDPEYQLIAGGSWGPGAHCGPRYRNAHYYRWRTNSSLGARFASEPLHKRVAR
jgi:hypothetical protein